VSVLRQLVTDTRDLLRTRPRLFAPFLLVAVVAAGLDALRLAGPVPATLTTVAQRGAVYTQLQAVPGVTSPIGLWPWAVLGLQPLALAHLLVTAGGTGLAGAAATAVVLARTDGRPVVSGSLRRRLLRAVPVIVGFDLLVWIGVGLATPLVRNRGVIAIFGGGVVVLLVARAFLVPAGVVAGRSLPSALRWSWRWTAGHGWQLGLLLLAVGGATHLLVSVPVLLSVPLPVGTLLATAVVGPAHAAVLAVAADRIGGDERRDPVTA
jgi:hypothetical protein